MENIGSISDLDNLDSLKIVVMAQSADNTMRSKLLKQKKIKTIHRLTLITTAIDGEGGYVDGYIETIEETDSSAIDIDFTHLLWIAERVALEDTLSPLRNQIQLTLKNLHMKIQNITLMLLISEEDTNPGGGQVTSESNLVEFDEESSELL